MAAGLYFPDEGAGQNNDSVLSKFKLKNNLKIYGGFKVGDTQLSDRDWENNLSVLSGDVSGNDTTDSNGNVTDVANIANPNAYHVVRARNAGDTAVLDGFTITARQANGVDDRKGGGFFCDGSGAGGQCSPLITNVNFVGNFANHNGGGMFNDGFSGGDSSPKLFNVTFQGNYSGLDGGALYNYGWAGVSNPELNQVYFYNNFTGKRGAGIYNTGRSGGESSPELMNVIFAGNNARQHGGAMFNDGTDGVSSPDLYNVLFSGNYAENFGGALYNSGSNGFSEPDLFNVTFSGNYAKSLGGAVFNSGASGSAHMDVYNGIFWNNTDINGTGTISATLYNTSASAKFWNSLVQGAGPSGSGALVADPNFMDGGSNIDGDPVFVTPVDPESAPTIEGSLRLQSVSPAIDAGFNPVVAGLTVDLDGEPRFVDGDMDGSKTVDMGAYEKQNPVSYLPFVTHLLDN